VNWAIRRNSKHPLAHWGVYAIIFSALIVISLLIGGTLIGSLLFGVIGTCNGFVTISRNLQQLISGLVNLMPKIPTSFTPFRNLIAALLGIAAFGFMVAAEVDLNPANSQQFMVEGGQKLLIGVILLGLALWFSTRQPALPNAERVPLSTPRRGWVFVVIIGIAILLVHNEANASFLDIPFLQKIHISVHHLMLFVGTLLIGYGFGGLPRLRFRPNRDEIGTVVLVAGITGLALFLRVVNLEVTNLNLVDELHWVDGLQRILWAPQDIGLLHVMSGQSPYTNIFPYWQTGAVSVFGHTWTGLRFVSGVIGALTVLAAYGVGKELFDRRTGLIAALVLATLPPHLHFSRIGLVSIGDPLFGVMAVLFVARALRNNRRIEWALAGISLGYTQYFYEGGRLLFPALIIAWLFVLWLGRNMHARWRGVLIMVITSLLIAVPVYTTIIGLGNPLFGRMGESGLGAEYWNAFFADGISINEILTHTGKILSAAYLYGAASDTSVYYGGLEALVNTLLVPFLMFGGFYILWRFPKPAVVIPIWIVGTSVGVSLVRDTVASPRFFVVLPALAIAIAVGIRYLPTFIAGIVPPTRAGNDPEVVRPRFLWRLGWVVTFAAAGVIAIYQTTYYFGPHLDIFDHQVRDSKPYRDGLDAAQNLIGLPDNTQPYIIGTPKNDTNVARHFAAYLSRNGGLREERYRPLLTITSGAMTPRFLRELRRGQGYAFFIEPDEQEAIRLIYRYFPDAEPIRYSPFNLPADREYVLIYAPPASSVAR